MLSSFCYNSYSGVSVFQGSGDATANTNPGNCSIEICCAQAPGLARASDNSPFWLPATLSLGQVLQGWLECIREWYFRGRESKGSLSLLLLWVQNLFLKISVFHLYACQIRVMIFHYPKKNTFNEKQLGK